MATISAASHLDHSLTEAHLAFVRSAIEPLDRFTILTVELPAELPPLPCGLHGPIMGDEPVSASEVQLVVRPGRVGASRMVNRPPRPSRKLTVIVGPDEGQTILFTTFAGPVAPREPFDLDLSGQAALEESRAFWAQHALSAS